MPFLINLDHFQPVFDMLWLWYPCQMLPTSILVPVLTGLSEIGKKNLNNCDLTDQNADFGHFSTYLAYFSPCMIAVWP